MQILFIFSLQTYSYKKTTEDYLKQASTDILTILKNPPATLPYLEAGSDTHNTIGQIAQLLNRSSNNTT